MSMISEIAEYLEDQSVGTVGTNIFYSAIPDEQPAQATDIIVLDTSGVAPNIDITEIKSPGFQIFIRSKNYALGKAKLDTIRDLLHGVIEQYLIAGGTYFRRIHANAEGGHVGRNKAGRDEFSINFSTSIIDP